MRETILPRLLMAICITASLGACAASVGQGCAPGSGTPVTVFTLFLGRSIPGGGDVTEQEWRDFLDATVSAELPDGYTIFDANGGWMNPVTHKTIKDTTKVLLVALPDGPASLAAVNRIRSAYQTRFRQRATGMTVQRACGAF